MWLPIIIVLAAVSLLVGPIMLMQPTSQQRREARLRDKAAHMGLRVQLAGKPKGLPEIGAFYCLPWNEASGARPQWLLRRTSYQHEMHVAKTWEWLTRSEELSESLLEQILMSAPDETFAVGAGPQGLMIYWSEIGGEERLQAIQCWLVEQQAKLAESMADPA